MQLRGSAMPMVKGPHGQVKTAADQAAEGCVLGYLRSWFPDDRFLSEELFEETGVRWDAPKAFWTVDALDGTRSFVEGFEGFCVQVAYLDAGAIQFGVVYEPVRQLWYWAVEGQGAFRETADGHRQPLRLDSALRGPPRFIDSQPLTGVAKDVMTHVSGAFLECGSFGVKMCRVAEGAAEVFLKETRFKFWDVAPAEAIVREAGGVVALWNGQRILYAGHRVSVDEGLLVASPWWHQVVRSALEAHAPHELATGASRRSA